MMPFRTIITTENIVSRPNAGLSTLCSITVTTVATSSEIADRVSINVP